MPLFYKVAATGFICLSFLNTVVCNTTPTMYLNTPLPTYPQPCVTQITHFVYNSAQIKVFQNNKTHPKGPKKYHKKQPSCIQKIPVPAYPIFDLPN